MKTPRDETTHTLLSVPVYETLLKVGGLQVHVVGQVGPPRRSPSRRTRHVFLVSGLVIRAEGDVVLVLVAVGLPPPLRGFPNRW